MDMQMQVRDFWSNQRENGAAINPDGEPYEYSGTKGDDQSSSGAC